ncbi:MAG: M1 family metallopeptidase [Myxococcales bacterium]|nr:M1 family metallopeptidase [Myxococcales bacterium]
MSREFALPGTRPRFAPDRPIDVEHYRLEVTLDPAARTIAGTATITATVIAAAITEVRLDAVELEVAAVRVDGAGATFTNDGRALRIAVARRAGGARLAIEVDYRAQPRRGLYFTAPDPGYPDKPAMAWTQGQDEDSRHWFPCVDAPHEKATSEVIATVPAAWTALSNGVLADDRRAGGQRTLHWRLDVPHACYLVTLVAGDLATIEARWRDVPVTYHVVRGREAEAQRTLARTPAMLELFSRTFGVDYPYPRYAQVFAADFIFGGMENTSATTLTDVILMDERAALDYDIDALVAHELAHQWFGDLVTCREWGEGWLNEGFATYAEYLWREHHEGRDAADLELDEWAEMYFGEDGGRYRRTVATKLYDEPIDIFDHHLYEKGGRVLHMLRQELGDDDLWKSLRHYLGKHRHGAVETRDLARAIEDATGRVLDWFFSQWVIDGAGHPELKVAISWDAEAKLAAVKIEQVHKVEGATPLFRLPAKVALEVDGVVHEHAIVIDARAHTWFFPAATEPTRCVFDPGRTLLAAVETDKSPRLWIAELTGAALASDRRHAARALGRIAGPLAQAALVRALADDDFWAVRGAAAAALAAIGNDGARDALVRATITEAHPRARRAIVRALGEFRRDTKVAAVLADLVERGDASYFVEAEACLALGKARAPQAPTLLRQAATRPSFTDVIRQHAYRGLAEARDDGALDVLVAGTRWGTPSGGRRAALTALASLCRGRRDRDAVRAREHVEELLLDRDFRVQAAALEALLTWGDRTAVPAIERMIARELDGRLRRRGKEIVRDLADGAGATEELTRLRDDVTALRATTATLRERLDKLDARPPAPPPPARRRAPARKRPTRAARPRRR